MVAVGGRISNQILRVEGLLFSGILVTVAVLN